MGALVLGLSSVSADGSCRPRIPALPSSSSLCYFDALSFHSLQTSFRSGFRFQRQALSTSNAAPEPSSEGEAPKRDGPSYLVSAYGWNVRDVNPKRQKDLQDIAAIQAEAFHEAAPFFDEFFFHLFKAEVLSALSYKVRLSPPRRYTCLISEAQEAREMVGVVDLTALSDKNILKHLRDADEYLYVSGLAVVEAYRRRNVATALLQGVDLRASEWGFKYLVLHAYENDVRARNVYSKAGYKVVALDPPWLTTWVGRKRRVIMAKQVPVLADIKSSDVQLQVGSEVRKHGNGLAEILVGEAAQK